MSMFEVACAFKLRFVTRKGDLTTEDLFDLPLQSDRGTSLEGLWISLNKEIKENDNSESPLKRKSVVNKDLETKFAIVSRVIEIRLTRREAAETNKTKKEFNEQIMVLIAKKENAERENLSIDELKNLMK